MRRWRQRLRSLRRYGEILQSPSDLMRYFAMRSLPSKRSTRPVALRVRSLGGAQILCRASAADVFTFKAVFLHEFHLPPSPLGASPTILDLGSNIGLTVAHFAHRYPTATVVGVEMDSQNYELAVRNTERYGDRVRLLHAAVWTRDGTITYGGERSDGYRVTSSEASAGETVGVADAMRIETIMDKYGWETVDYLKMDVEGAEAELLANDPRWMERVRMMKVELHPPADRPSVMETLLAHGFRAWPDREHANCVCAIRQ